MPYLLTWAIMLCYNSLFLAFSNSTTSWSLTPSCQSFKLDIQSYSSSSCSPLSFLSMPTSPVLPDLLICLILSSQSSFLFTPALLSTYYCYYYRFCRPVSTTKSFNLTSSLFHFIWKWKLPGISVQQSKRVSHFQQLSIHWTFKLKRSQSLFNFIEDTL